MPYLEEGSHAPLAIAFDVNETLLDLAALDPVFVDVFGEAGARADWFSSVIHTATVLTAAGSYEDFSQIAVEALRSLAVRRGVRLVAGDERAILHGLRNPACPPGRGSRSRPPG